MTSEYKGSMPDYAFNSQFNAVSFLIEQNLKNKINTAIPVRVDSVDGGYVSATPLIMQMDGEGKVLPNVSIPRLPYARIQGGKAALIVDPAPGDIGIAIFAQQDISLVKEGQKEPVQAGSFRYFDMSDGMYIGGMLNARPETYVEVKDDGNINVIAEKAVTIETKEAVINGATSVVVETNECHLTASTISMKGETTLEGNLTVTGNANVGGSITIGGGGGAAGIIKGDVSVEGNISSSGRITAATVTASGVGLTSHIHGGVQSGGSNTFGPQG